MGGGKHETEGKTLVMVGRPSVQKARQTTKILPNRFCHTFTPRTTRGDSGRESFHRIVKSEDVLGWRDKSEEFGRTDAHPRDAVHGRGVGEQGKTLRISSAGRGQNLDK